VWFLQDALKCCCSTAGCAKEYPAVTKDEKLLHGKDASQHPEQGSNATKSSKCWKTEYRGLEVRGASQADLLTFPAPNKYLQGEINEQT